LLGEWLFSRALFGSRSDVFTDAYFQDILMGKLPEHAKSDMSASHVTNAFLDEVRGALGNVPPT
jgi:hypothetical protein